MSERPPSAYEAHPFEPDPEHPERCAVCGERAVQIRHHPTRIRAARALRGPAPPAPAQRPREGGRRS